MSIKGKVLASAALLTMVGGVSMIGELSANGATPTTPPSVSIYSAKFGTDFIETVSHGGVAKVGQQTVLDRTDSSNQAQNIIGHRGGLVSDFFKAGLVSAEVNKHYGNLNAAEIEYAPNGVPSHLCVGLETTAYQNEALSLQACDTPGTTVWIIDTADSPATAAKGYFPLINGSTTDFVHPFGMTYYGDPSHKTSPIRAAHLLNNPTQVHANQLWGVLK
ncbi:hypothetical protein ABZV67_46925 [Streptomyces sp. NPDC005065]|uniref:hypothetical protein n=1 Tax=Streptomyces sp. NPDC005065 TaxID=3154461 RepID=UPI0033A7A47C